MYTAFRPPLARRVCPRIDFSPASVRRLGPPKRTSGILRASTLFEATLLERVHWPAISSTNRMPGVMEVGQTFGGGKPWAGSESVGVQSYGVLKQQHGLERSGGWAAEGLAWLGAGWGVLPGLPGGGPKLYSANIGSRPCRARFKSRICVSESEFFL